MSYSQKEEEKYILEAVGSSVGVFLDIGADDGISFSNVLALVERGWSGVFVEPNFLRFGRLLERHGGKLKLQLVQALVGVERRLRPFWSCDDVVSTTEEEHHKRWSGAGSGFGPAAGKVEFHHDYYASQVTVRELMDTFPQLKVVDVVSIDTEGTSADIFFWFPFDICRPRVICVEHDNQESRLEEFARHLGYEVVYRNVENLLFVRRDNVAG